MSENHETTTALVPRNSGEIPRAEVLPLAETILANKPLFGNDLTALQAGQLARVALMYGLDPIAGELTIYQGRPWVTLDGRLRQAQKHDAFDGIEGVRPASEQERRDFRCREDEDLWVATVWRKDRQYPFVGYGRAGGKYEKNFIVKNEDRGPELAQKRALGRALRYAFSLPLPGGPDDDADERTRTTITISHEPPIDAEPRITEAQVVMVHALAGKLELDEDAYRGRLEEMFGVRTCLALSEGEAQAVLDAFSAELAVESEPRSERVGGRVDDLVRQDQGQDVVPLSRGGEDAAIDSRSAHPTIARADLDAERKKAVLINDQVAGAGGRQGSKDMVTPHHEVNTDPKFSESADSPDRNPQLLRERGEAVGGLPDSTAAADAAVDLPLPTVGRGVGVATAGADTRLAHSAIVHPSRTPSPDSAAVPAGAETEHASPIPKDRDPLTGTVVAASRAALDYIDRLLADVGMDGYKMQQELDIALPMSLDDAKRAIMWLETKKAAATVGAKP